jgi:hypothetical protein
MKKYKLVSALLLLTFTAFCWSNCTVCTISVQNDTDKKIDSVRFNLGSENKFSFLLKEIQAQKIVTRTIAKDELKLGHYFFISTIIYSKDSVYNGPEMATDIVYGGEKYKLLITKEKAIFKIVE